MPAAQIIDIADQFGPHRHCGFGGSRRRWRPHIRDIVDQRGIGFVPDRGNDRDGAGGYRAHHGLFVKAPQVFDRATTTRHDQQIGPGHGAAGDHGVEPLNGIDHFGGAGIALNPHRPDHDMAGEAVGQAMQDIADHRARGGGDHTDHAGQIGQGLFTFAREQPFGGQLALALLKQRHQRTGTRGLNIVDDDLVFGGTREGGQPPGGDHLKPLFGLEGQLGVIALPDDGVN